MPEETPPPGLPPLRDVIREGSLSARKALGQNYLLDLNLTARIARAAGPLQGVTVVEVGPGPGGLTRALLAEGAARVVAIERDPRFMPALDRIAAHYPGRLLVLAADALTVDYPALAKEHGATRIAANLPYNIATPLLAGWLTDCGWPPWWDRLCLMFQKEVAERIVAAPGGKAYGRLSVLAQARTRAKILFTLPARAFTPPPKVDSALVAITPLGDGPFPAPITALERVTAAAFGQRRKMLRASLQAVFPAPKDVLAVAGIPDTARAEELSVGQFWRLAALITARH